MKHTKTLFLILTAAIFFCASARSSQIKIESAEANRRPAAVSSGYLAWFPLRIEGQETGPLVYTFRVRNAGEEKIAVRVQVESYIRGSERHDGDESVLTRLEPGESDLLPLRLQPPRTPGSYEAKIVFQTQTPGMMGSLMPWGWDKTHSENLEFRVVDSGSPTFPSPSKPSLGRILSSRPPYEVPTDEAVLMTLNILLDTLGSFAMGETAGIPGVGAEVQARMEPSLLAESLQMQRPRLKERDDKKILSLSALVRDVEVATARYHSYSPGFDRVVFTVLLPEGVRVPEQEGWLTKIRDGRVAAVGIVEGVDKRIGRMKGIENPSLELRYDDNELEEEYTVEANAAAMVGPFARPAEDEELSESAIWPDTGLQVSYRRRLSESPWVYDYEKWRRNPDEVTWYAMSTTMPMEVSAEPAEEASVLTPEIKVSEIEWSEYTELSGHTDRVRSIAFSGDGRFLASGSDNRILKIWDLQSKRAIHSFNTGWFVRSVAFHPNDSLVGCGSYDRNNQCSRIQFWDIETGKLSFTLEGRSRDFVSTIRFSPDGRLFACLYRDTDFLEVYDTESWETIWTSRLRHSFTIAFSHDGELIGVSFKNKKVEIFEAKSGQRVERLNTGDKMVGAISFSPDSNFLAAGTGTGGESVYIWDLSSGKTETNLTWFNPHPFQINVVQNVEYSPDGLFLIAGARDGYIRIIDPTEKRLLRSIEYGSNLGSFTFSLDGKYLAVVDGRDISILKRE